MFRRVGEYFPLMLPQIPYNWEWMHRIFIDSIFTDIVTFTLKCSIIFGVLVTRFNEFSLYTSNRINFVELILGYLERKTMWKFLKKHRRNLGGSILLKLIENVPVLVCMHQGFSIEIGWLHLKYLHHKADRFALTLRLYQSPWKQNLW